MTGSPPPGEWRPDVDSDGLLTQRDLIRLLSERGTAPDSPALTAHQVRWIASLIYHPCKSYADYRYTLGFRHGCDYQKRELEDAALRAAEVERDEPGQLDLLDGAA